MVEGLAEYMKHNQR